MQTSSAIETYRGVVYPNDCDAMGHMNVKAYTGAYDQAMWHLVHAAGYSASWVKQCDEGWVDAEHLTRFKHELAVGSLYKIVSRITKIGTTSVRSFHELFDVDRAEPASTCEMVSIYFDLKVRKPKPLRDELAQGLRGFLDRDMGTGQGAAVAKRDGRAGKLAGQE